VYIIDDYYYYYYYYTFTRVYNAYYAYILRTNDQQRRQRLWICDIFIYLNKAFVILQYMDQQLLVITKVCKRQSIMNENGCVVDR